MRSSATHLLGRFAGAVVTGFEISTKPRVLFSLSAVVFIALNNSDAFTHTGGYVTCHIKEPIGFRSHRPLCGEIWPPAHEGPV